MRKMTSMARTRKRKTDAIKQKGRSWGVTLLRLPDTKTSQRASKVWAGGAGGTGGWRGPTVHAALVQRAEQRSGVLHAVVGAHERPCGGKPLYTEHVSLYTGHVRSARDTGRGKRGPRAGEGDRRAGGAQGGTGMIGHRDDHGGRGCGYSRECSQGSGRVGGARGGGGGGGGGGGTWDDWVGGLPECCNAATRPVLQRDLGRDGVALARLVHLVRPLSSAGAACTVTARGETPAQPKPPPPPPSATVSVLLLAASSQGLLNPTAQVSSLERAERRRGGAAESHLGMRRCEDEAAEDRVGVGRAHPAPERLPRARHGWARRGESRTTEELR